MSTLLNESFKTLRFFNAEKLAIFSIRLLLKSIHVNSLQDDNACLNI